MNYRRGVSDLVAFTLVFSTIVFLIGAITITGITTLEDVQAGTESNVAEATMQSFATTLGDHRTESAPSRSMTIKLQGHSFRRVSSTVDVNVSSGGSTSNISVATGAFVRETDTDTRLVYESGGLFRISEDGGVVVVREPPIRCDTDTVHLPLTLVRGDTNITADGRVTVRSELADQQLRYPANTSQNTSADNVVINVRNTAFPDAWQSFLESSDGWGPSDSGVPSEYECDFGGSDGRVIVHETAVNVDVVS